MINLNNYSHSDDSLKIVKRDFQYCVCKTFHSDLVRAKRNVDKQKKFNPLYTGTVNVTSAEVISFEVYAEHAELVMPFIEGITGHMFPVHATRNVARSLSCSLSTLLYSELNESRENIVAVKLFSDKLGSVYDSTHDLQLKKILQDCQKVIDILPSEIIFPLGNCHGDLTLSNVIVNQLSGITLIDFLDTYLETPLQDVAKLMQDYVYGWSFRKSSPSIAVKAEILCRYHYPIALTQIERMYPAQVKLLTLMALARIAPYVKDDITQQWLVRSIERCIGGFSK